MHEFFFFAHCLCRNFFSGEPLCTNFFFQTNITFFLTVRLSSEVSSKAQKYTRVGPCQFVQYDEEELSTKGIKAACEKHFSPSLERKGLSCDVLAGEQGPSCLFDPFNGEFLLIVLHKLAGPYLSILLGFARYF